MSETRPLLATTARQDMAAEVPVLKNRAETAPGTRPVAAEVDHFRIVGSGDGGGASTMVLYREGAHIPPEHRGLDAVLAVFDDDSGAWMPQEADVAPVVASTVDSPPKRGRR